VRDGREVRQIGRGEGSRPCLVACVSGGVKVILFADLRGGEVQVTLEEKTRKMRGGDLA